MRDAAAAHHAVRAERNLTRGFAGVSVMTVKNEVYC